MVKILEGNPKIYQLKFSTRCLLQFLHVCECTSQVRLRRLCWSLLSQEARSLSYSLFMGWVIQLYLTIDYHSYSIDLVQLQDYWLLLIGTITEMHKVKACHKRKVSGLNISDRGSMFTPCMQPVRHPRVLAKMDRLGEPLARNFRIRASPVKAPSLLP